MQIKILNQVFQLQGVNDPEHIRKLVAYVENVMTELQRQTNTIDSQRLALLTALHIADDYFKALDQYRQYDQHIGRKCAEYIQVLEQFTA